MYTHFKTEPHGNMDIKYRNMDLEYGIMDFECGNMDFESGNRTLIGNVNIKHVKSGNRS